MTLKSQVPQLSTVGSQEENTQRGQGCFAGRAAGCGGSRRELGRAARQQYPATHSLLPLSSRGEGFCAECPMKPTEHMNKNVGVYYALSSTASWNGLLVKMKSGVYSKAFSDVSGKNPFKITALGKIHVLHIL